jgi:DNA-binding NarL/FixJ family response regulator
LAGLVARVGDALEGRPAAPARLETQTNYGRFILRAYALEPAADGGAAAFGVQIEKHLPAPVRMVRSAAFRRLTPREQDIGRLLSTGFSYPRIAELLGVEPSTVVTHVRNLADKLGVTGREEIVRALCA